MKKISYFFKTNYILVLLLVFGLFFRIYNISRNPPSLNWDEISHGYNAYSILKTGNDEWGLRLPLIFRAYGDFKLPLYIYLTAFSELFLGLNVFSVRLISILSGLGLVLVAYWIVKKYTKSDFWGMIAALLTVVSPWSLFLSRVAVEANLGAFLFALGIYFLISWQEKESKKDLIFMAFFWGLSLHSYNSARILVPLFAFGAFWLVIVRKKSRQLIFPFIVLVAFILPVVFQFSDHSARARFDWVSLIDQGAVATINEKRTTSKLPKPLPKLVFNKATYFIYTATRNYLANFSPKYLFFRGGSHYQFSLPDHELLYLVTAPFLILGLTESLKSKKKRLTAIWFFAAFIPSAITRDSPHVLRSIFVLPTPMILMTLGVKSLNDFLEKKSALKGKLVNFVFILAVLFSFSRWWRDYVEIYPKGYSWAWQYGYRETVDFTKENYQKFDKIFFTKKYGEPHEFVAFYYPWDPKNFQQQKKWDYHANWYWVDSFGKFVFVNDWEVAEKVICETGLKCLLVASPNNYPSGWNNLKKINFLDGKTAFEILEKK